MSKLQLILLGHFDCLLPSGERISLSMRKAEVLLAYLALAPGIRHPRERLLNLLWSDRGEEQARNSLRQCLSAIKKSLGDVADLVIQVDRTTVRLIPDLVDVDALEFERLATDAGLESLSNAAALYAGEFLEGISIRDAASQDWLEAERSRFKRQYIEILTNLGHTLLASRDPGKTIKIAERLVAEDALGESGWRLLMRAYYEHDDRSHALQAFKRCQQALHSELDVEPEAATLDLREQIADSQTKPASMPLHDNAAQDFKTAPSPASSHAKAPVDGSSASGHRIAVLPFDNLSGDPEQEYFSDGITDSIILNLSMFRELQVKSRNSSFAFKQQIKDLGEISRELNVDYLVEGSIRKSSDRIRITVQLIEAANGNQIWGKRYDADIENLFDLEEELSRSIAATVTGQIESDLQRIALAKGAAGQQAYDFLLSGIYHLNRSNRQDIAIAIDKLEQCLQQDPDNVRAHAALYQCHVMNWMDRLVEDYQTSFELAGYHARKAFALDPELGEAQYTYGEYLMFCRDYEQAEVHIEIALTTNPNNPDYLTGKAMLLSMRGEFEAAIDLAVRAYHLDPYNWWVDWNLAEAQYLCHRYQDALDTIAKSRNAPGFIRIYSTAANVKLGRMDAARQSLQTYLAECRESMRAMPRSLDDWLSYTTDTAPYADPQINQDIIDCLVQAGLTDEPSSLQGAKDGDDRPSLLVLPFKNISDDPEQEYFSDGITESIILSLSSFNGLKVKSRHASFAFKNSPRSISEISEELGVQYIVEGSIRKFGDQVRITVQLGDASNGNQLWGKRFDSSLTELFSLEEEMVKSIAGTISGRIGKEIKIAALGKPAKDLKSFDYLMRGLFHLEKFSPSDNLIAREQFEKCLERDSGNGEACSLLGETYVMELYENWTADRDEARRLMRIHADRAVELEPDNALAHAFTSEQLLMAREFERALFHAERAIELNPTLPDGYSMKCSVLGSVRRYDEALEYAGISMQIDPYHPYMGWNAGEVYRTTGHYERAVKAFRTIPHVSPSLRAQTAASLAGMGNIDEARAEMQRYLELAQAQMPNLPKNETGWRKLWYEIMPFQHEEDSKILFELLLKAGLCDDLNVIPDDLPSILVLPFKNMSGDPGQEYFSDGISESIISSLGAFSGPRVKSRHTSFAFKNSSRSLDEIAAELEVNFIVEGSIRKSAERVRINVQLVESASGDQLWAKRFDSDLSDLFTLEDELTSTIAATISGRIGKEIKNLSLHKPLQNLQSYDYLMRGLYQMEKFTAEDVRSGREQLLKSIEHDPKNAEATAILASSYIIDLYENWSADRDESKRLMKFYGQRALEIEADNAMAHALLAEQLLFTRDYQRAETQVERAIEINPTLPDGYSVKAVLMGSIRRYDEALENAELAMQLDPYHPYTGWNAGEVYRTTGQFERAITAFRSIPLPSPSLRAQTAAALVGLGKIEEARAEMKAYLELARAQMPHYPDNESEWRELWSECVAYQLKEDSDTLFDQLLQAGLCDDLQDQPDNHPSILVLPFKNMSDEPEQEYFSDGITTSLILSLGMFDGLTARPQNTSFAYKNSTKSSQEIASEVEADFLIEGSIRKSGSKLRLSVQLVESASAGQIWGKQYDAELEDILDLEQELSQTVAATISGRIGHTLQQSAIRKSAKNLHSYDYLLRGLYHLGRLTARDLQSARQMIDKCIETDPDNATAHTNLGMIGNIELMENWTSNRKESEQSAQHHLARALELDPENSLAHAYMAEFLFYIGEYEQSEFHADRAIEVNPTASEGYAVKADLLGFIRRIDEAVPYADKCIRLDPHSVGSGWVAGAVYRKAGLYQKAIKTFRAIAHPPASVHGLIAVCFVNLDLPDEARKEILLYKKLARQEMPFYPRSETEWRVFWRNNMPYQHEEDFDAFFELLKTAGLLDRDTEAVDEVPSIAVLPFENMSDDPEQAFFSEGITADIISTLSKFRHLHIVARHSTEIYRNRKVPIAEIAQQQQVRYILEGSVRRSGQRIRVSAELIDSQSEQNCWSERYDRDLDDLFAVQDEITQKITLAMKVHLDDGDMAVHRSAGTSNIKAWELTMTAVDLQDTYIRQNILEARAMANQALALDPGYVFAWVVLAWSHWQEVYSGWSKSREESLGEAEKASRRALDLDPDHADALSQAGTGYLMRHDADKALEYCQKAVELEPGNAENQALLAFALVFVGDYEQARLHFQNVHKLCPILPNWYFLIGAQIEQYDGDLERAIAIYRQGLAVEPDAPLCRFYLVNALMKKGDTAGAQQYADEIRALDSSVNGSGLVHAFSKDARLREEFHENLAKFNLV